MQKIFITILAIVTMVLSLQAQPGIEVEGSIKVDNDTDLNPELGTIRWSGSDFEGWNGVIWASLTGNKEVGTVADRDGNVYKTIRIGSRVWMVENLRVRQFNDGRGIPLVSIGWESVTFPARCSYDNNENLVDTYGYLYNWFAVDDGKLCPIGWHVPSDAEWTTLTDFLGGESVAGGPMKEAGMAHWNSPNTGATNSSGFSGLPGGYRFSTGLFFNIGDNGNWWSSTDSGSAGLYRSLDYNFESSLRTGTDKDYGFSVRCVRD